MDPLAEWENFNLPVKFQRVENFKNVLKITLNAEALNYENQFIDIETINKTLQSDPEKPLLLFRKYIEESRIESGVYYIIKKCFVKLFKIFLNSVTLDKKYEIVSKIYKEMNVKHVPIALEIEIVILKYLMEQENDLKSSENEFIDLDGRIKIICYLIDEMKMGYNPDVENIISNNKFVDAGKLLLQNIRVLKYLQVKEFVKVPLDELEYYLSIFLIVVTREKYDDIIDPMVIFILDVKMLLDYLKNLKLVLQRNDFDENVFKDLTENYIKLRNICSLRKIIHYLEAATKVDLNKNESLAVLVIQRTFQVFGEQMHDTKMSDDLKYILCSHTFSGFSENMKNIRNFFSHVGTMIHRWKTDINIETFKKIQQQFIKNLPIVKHLITKEKQIALKSFVNGMDKQAILDRFKYSRQISIYFNEFDETGPRTIIEHPHQEIIDVIKEIMDFIPVTELSPDGQEIFNQISKHPFIFDEHWCVFMDAMKRSNVNKDNVLNYLHLLQKCCYFIDNDKSGEDKCYQKIISLIDIISKNVEATTKPKNNRIIAKLKMLQNFKETNLLGSFNFDLYKSKYQPMDLIKEINQIFNRLTKKIGSLDVIEEIEQEVNFYNNSLKLKQLLNKECVGESDFIELINLNQQLGSIVDCNDLKIKFEDKNLSTLSHKVDSTTSLYKTLLKNIAPYCENVFNVKNKEKSLCIFFKNFTSYKKITKELKVIFEEDKRELQAMVDKRWELFNKITSGSTIENSRSNSEDVIKKCSKNSNLSIGLEMIALDMSVLLKNLQLFPFDRYFMDEYSPALHGRALRNYLAHGDMLYELVIDDCSKQVIVNLENIFNNSKNIFNLRKSLVSGQKSEPFLQNKIQNVLSWTESQSTLWKTVLDNRFDDIHNDVKNGADLYSKTKLFFNLPTDSELFKIGSRLSILHKKVLWNNKDDVLIFLKNNKNIQINQKDDQGHTPLHYAVFHGNSEIANILLEYGANVNAVPKSYKTPLVLSCFQQDFTMAELLIKNGAEINDLTILKPYLLRLAVICNNKLVVEMFSKMRKLDSASFLIAIVLDCDEIVEIFLNSNSFKVSKLMITYSTRKNSCNMINLFYKRKLFTKNTVFDCRYTLLMHAAESNAIDAINVLINLGFDVNAINDKGNTALHCAAAYGQGEAIRELLKAKAVTNIQNLFKQIPLHLAANSSCLLANELLANKTDLMILDDNDWTSLHRAAYYNQAEVIKLFLKVGVDVNIRSKTRNTTPLHLACQWGNLKATIKLVENKADINAEQFGYGTTPLMKAINANQIAIVKYLISKGATIKNYAVMTAVENKNLQIVTALLHKMSLAERSVLLMAAVSHVEFETVKIFISSGVSFKFEDAVVMALAKQANEILHFLFESGANLFFKYTYGRSVLHLAVDCCIIAFLDNNIDMEEKTTNLVKYLVNKGVKVNDVDNDGNTPLHIAISMGSKESVPYAIFNDLNATIDQELKELNSVCKQKCLLVQDLLSNKSNVNTLNAVGLSPLHLATVHNHPESLQNLIKKGANVDIRVRNGSDATSLLLASNRGYLECARVLVNSNANINVRDFGNFRPILHAIVREHLDLLKYLLEEKATVDFEIFSWALKSKNDKVMPLIIDSLTHDNQMMILRDAIIENNDLVIKAIKNANLSGSSIAVQIDTHEKSSEQPTVVDNKLKTLVLPEMETNVKEVATQNNEKSEEKSTGTINKTMQPGKSKNKSKKRSGLAQKITTNGDEKPANDAEKLLKLNQTEIESLLTELILKEDLITVESILTLRSIDLNKCNKNGSFLCLAVKQNSVPMLKLLVKYGADVTKKHMPKSSLLCLAVENSAIEVLEFLIKNESNINDLLLKTQTSNDQFTLLHIASNLNQSAVIKLFAKKGANLNIKSKSKLKDTPMTLAASLGKFEAIKVLIENNADINLPRSNGVTPLMAAIVKDEMKIVEYLIEKGASITSNTFIFMMHNMDKIDFLWTAEELLALSIAHNNQNAVKVFLHTLRSGEEITDMIMCNAVRKNHLKVVTILSGNGCSLNIETIDKCSLMYLAANKNAVDVLEYLFKNGVDVNSRTWLGSTPLHGAAYTKSVAAVKLLIEAGGLITNKDDQDTLPIHIAAIKGNLELNDLLSNKKIINCFDREQGFTPLMYAVQYKVDPSIVKLFIEKGADVNLKAKIDDKNTALHIACEHDNLEAVKILLGNNASVTIKNANKETALWLAKNLNKTEVIKCFTELLRKENTIEDKTKKIELAFISRDEKTIIEILSSGYGNVNKVIGQMGNCMQYAVLQNLNILKLLEEMGGDLLIRNSNRESLLYLAAKCNAMNVLQYLIESVLDVNDVNADGNTALHATAINNCLESAKLLIKGKALTNIMNKASQMPIHIAATQNNIELNKILSTRKNLLIGDKDNKTPLHLAVETNLPDIIKLFIKKGVDVDLMYPTLSTPLLVACTNGNIEAAEALIENKADINKPNVMPNVSPLQVVNITNNLDMMRCLLKPKMNIAKIDSRLKTVTPSIPSYFHARGKGCQTTAHAVQILCDISKIEREHMLSNAIKDGLYDMVELLLSFCDVNEYHECESPLIEAIFQNDLPIMKLLIERGADLSMKNQRGYSLLHVAMTYTYKEFEMAELLISKGICVNSKAVAGVTPLHFAVMNCFNSTAKKIVEINPDAIADKITCESPPTERELEVLAQFCQWKYCDLNGIHLSKMFNEDKLMYKRLINNNSLHMAIIYDNNELVQVFADCNADLNEKFTYFNDLISPVLAANYSKAFNVLICLLKNGSEIDYVLFNPFLILNLKLGFVKLVFLDRLHNRNVE